MLVTGSYMDIFVTWENNKNTKDLISYLQAGDYSM